MFSLTIDREYLIKTLADLIRINSINPQLVPEGRGEAEIAIYMAEALRRLNLEVTMHEPAPGRVSVVGRLQGKGGGRSLMLNGHIDTVGIEGMVEPFSAAIRNGRMYGRGAYDMKGSLAACMAAMKALVEAKTSFSGEVLLAAVADEEYFSLGTADVISRNKVDGAIVAEATEMNLCRSHKGFVWLEVETFGRAAHGSRFDEGVDANMMMGRFLAELDKLEKELRARPPHPLVGPPSLHAALISGGSGLSTYAASCKLKIERRTIPGETEALVVSEIQKIVDRLAAADPTFKASVRAFCTREPFEVAESAEIVRAVEKATMRVRGIAPRHIGQTFWMDSALLAAAGVETVVIGPIGAGAHADEEWVDLQSLVDLAQILAETTVDYCR
ncbi:MAG: ArgE/DapE family deacylase [candidate division KSB1 bacterium]|nr:ArgE/DapE family deacylase [candidate division KSB1 bacterium]MDZ7364671.1 ArgE/DapE family deacylase [candidate division KSB1 bacterium]MDZ7402581.1 ArgE/DapE family deacylase [candidate division KSB1 bacterium]